MGRTFLRFAFALACLAFVGPHAQALPWWVPSPAPRDSRSPDPTWPAGSASAPPARAPAAVDTVRLYGGPGTLAGKFQNSLGQPDRQGWTGVDLTERPSFWQVSQFNAANLGGHGAGNHAMWAGQSAAQQPRWAGGDGYGNDWFSILEWRSGPLIDASVAQTVGLDFVFNHETQPDYDYLMVRYQRGAQWVDVLTVDASNKDGGGTFQPPGVQYGAAGAAPITFLGNDYGGEGADEIVLQLVVVTDGEGSDEDGLWGTAAGAAQVDDITVAWNDGVQSGLTSFTDFEGMGPFAWIPKSAPFVGDYSLVMPRLIDPDPCRDNPTPQFTFIDDGSPPNNAPPGTPIGPASSPTHTDYGPPFGWVVNYTGGLLHDGVSPIENQIWSPPITWDHPGPADDGPGWRTLLRFQVFDHTCCFSPGYTSLTRTSADGGTTWSSWSRHSNFVYYVPAPAGYRDMEIDLTRWIPTGTTRVQIAFEMWHPFLLVPPAQAYTTPAPWIDNVALLKVRSGAQVQASAWDLLQDGFPPVGTLDASTPGARDGLDVPLDRAAALGGGGVDSMAVTVIPSDPTQPVDPQQIRLCWILERNPLFEDALRTLPPGAVADAGVGPRGWPQWSGEAAAQPSTYPNGTPRPNAWFFDLPDVDFLYPGDALRYHVRVQEPSGIVSTLPAVLDGFASGVDYDPTFMVRALPTLTDASGTVPAVLFVDDSPSDAALHRLTLDQIGLHEGVQVDRYLARYPDAAASRIGAAGGHGATAAQLSGYQVVLQTTGARAALAGFAADAGLLDAWHQLPGDRTTVLFGGHVTQVFGPAPGYLAARAGVALGDPGIKDDIGGQSAPVVAPLEAAFTARFAVNMGCPAYRTDYERLVSVNGAAAFHGYLQPGGGGQTYPGIPASVVWDRIDGQGGRRVDFTFPYGLGDLQDPYAKEGSRPARAVLLQEILAYAGTSGAGTPTATPSADRPGILGLHGEPNPFNPMTTIHFALGTAGDCSVELFGVRGNRVATLHRGALPAGSHAIRWDGRDGAGAAVASGVYLVRVRAGLDERVLKLALVR